MAKTLIKICGIRNVEIAKQTILAGAEYIGLIFYPKSKRYVNVEQAKNIAATVIAQGATPVAVFVDQSAQEMLNICEMTNISTIQLHGSNARQQHHLLPAHYQRIYVLSVAQEGSINADIDDGLKHCDPTRDFLLFDNEQAGSGLEFNREKFHYQGNFRWFLAGGLTAENVAQAIDQLKPTGVDVSSGVENKLGEKDMAMIEKFIQQKPGRYGKFGGAYVPELLIEPMRELTEAWEMVKYDQEFQRNFRDLLKNYAGRPTALTEVARFSEAIDGPQIFLKREDLLHTGAHKLNNALGQCLLAKKSVKLV